MRGILADGTMGRPFRDVGLVISYRLRRVRMTNVSSGVAASRHPAPPGDALRSGGRVDPSAEGGRALRWSGQASVGGAEA
jgi:hypothetical protein